MWVSPLSQVVPCSRGVRRAVSPSLSKAQTALVSQRGFTRHSLSYADTNNSDVPVNTHVLRHVTHLQHVQKRNLAVPSSTRHVHAATSDNEQPAGPVLPTPCLEKPSNSSVSLNVHSVNETPDLQKRLASNRRKKRSSIPLNSRHLPWPINRLS